MNKKKGVVELAPVDYLILDELPPEGSMLGYHVVGVTVAGLVPKFKEGGIDSAQISGRLSSMRVVGLVTTAVILPISQGQGYQITPKGQKILSQWKREQKKDTEPASEPILEHSEPTSEQKVESPV